MRPLAAALVLLGLGVMVGRQLAPPGAPSASAVAGQDEAAARATAVILGARERHRWSERDAGELRATFGAMSPAQRARALRELSTALNRGEMRADVLPPI